MSIKRLLAMRRDDARDNIHDSVAENERAEDIKKTLFKQDKGQEKCIEQFLKSIRDNSYEPIPIRDIFLIQEKIFSIT